MIHTSKIPTPRQKQCGEIYELFVREIVGGFIKRLNEAPNGMDGYQLIYSSTFCKERDLNIEEKRLIRDLFESAGWTASIITQNKSDREKLMDDMGYDVGYTFILHLTSI